ncbi:MAG: hypothetical protein AB7F86_08675 [Bdellovibrionales bacterium]
MKYILVLATFNTFLGLSAWASPGIQCESLVPAKISRTLLNNGLNSDVFAIYNSSEWIQVEEGREPEMDCQLILDQFNQLNVERGIQGRLFYFGPTQKCTRIDDQNVKKISFSCLIEVLRAN